MCFSYGIWQDKWRRNGWRWVKKKKDFHVCMNKRILADYSLIQSCRFRFSLRRILLSLWGERERLLSEKTAIQIQYKSQKNLISLSHSLLSGVSGSYDTEEFLERQRKQQRSGIKRGMCVICCRLIRNAIFSLFPVLSSSTSCLHFSSFSSTSRFLSFLFLSRVLLCLLFRN